MLGDRQVGKTEVIRLCCSKGRSNQDNTAQLPDSLRRGQHVKARFHEVAAAVSSADFKSEVTSIGDRVCALLVVDITRAATLAFAQVRSGWIQSVGIKHAFVLGTKQDCKDVREVSKTDLQSLAEVLGSGVHPSHFDLSLTSGFNTSLFVKVLTAQLVWLRSESKNDKLSVVDVGQQLSKLGGYPETKPHALKDTGNGQLTQSHFNDLQSKAVATGSHNASMETSIATNLGTSFQPVPQTDSKASVVQSPVLCQIPIEVPGGRRRVLFQLRKGESVPGAVEAFVRKHGFSNSTRQHLLRRCGTALRGGPHTSTQRMPHLKFTTSQQSRPASAPLRSSTPEARSTSGQHDELFAKDLEACGLKIVDGLYTLQTSVTDAGDALAPSKYLGESVSGRGPVDITVRVPALLEAAQGKGLTQ